MREDDFTFLAALLKRRSGYVLTRDKTHLLSVRLKPVMDRYGFKSIDTLIADLRHGQDTLARSVAEAMTINDSFFFRDEAVFNHILHMVIPEFMRRRVKEKKLRIWCAAVSSGQEAYSMAMILDHLKLVQQGWAVDLIATDLNPEMIARAESGLYSSYEVERGSRLEHRLPYFNKEGDRYRVKDHIRRIIQFRSFNLLDSFGWLDELDLVLCRNVLMYFDERTRHQTLDKIAEVLRPDGILLLGSAETPIGHANASFDADGHGFYRKAPSVLRPAALSA